MRAKLCAAAALAGGLLLASAPRAAPVSGQGTWETTLEARDISGNPLASLLDPAAVFFHESTRNVTWLADWNAAAGSPYDDGSSTIDGRMTWDSADAWVKSLAVGGFGGWRLPTVIDIGNDGCNSSYAGGTDCGFNVDTDGSELAYVWYVLLGNKARCPPGNTTCTGPGVPQPGYGLTNTGPFINFEAWAYWSGTEYYNDPTGVWGFSTIGGDQTRDAKILQQNAVALRNGDVFAGTAPEPSTLALLGLGLAGLAASRRRKQ